MNVMDYLGGACMGVGAGVFIANRFRDDYVKHTRGLMEEFMSKAQAHMNDEVKKAYALGHEHGSRNQSRDRVSENAAIVVATTEAEFTR